MIQLTGLLFGVSLCAPQASFGTDISGIYESEMKQSLTDYYSGNLHFKPFVQGKGIYGFSVYRGKKLILHKTAKGDHIYSLWISFAHKQTRAKPIHQFDGDEDDFLPSSNVIDTNPFVDLNGDGVPELIVADADTARTTGYDIYSLTEPVKKIAQVKYSFPSMRFIDIDHDGKYEALTWDPTFRYWCECGALSPSPLVILHFDKNNNFELATNLMRTNPPNHSRQTQILAEWSKLCDKDRKQPDEFHLSSTVWRDMLYLIYSGNSKVAFALLDKLWQPKTFATNLTTNSRASKELFIKMFLQRLSESPYIKGIRLLNQNDPTLQRDVNARGKTIFLNRYCG